MDKVILPADRRIVTGKQVNALRREGKLPAVIYGHNFEATPISLDLKETTKVLSGLTSSSLVTILLENKEYPALVRDRQRDYIRNRLIHLDFQVVNLTEKIRANVSVDLEGVSPAVKDFNGVVVTGLSELEVECLPQDLPERLTIDLSKLMRIGDAIHVKDISFGENVTIHQDPEEMIVLVTASIEEAVEVELAEGEAAEPEIIEKGKKEEEESED
ncbi:MAG TPA: 50S ribosomal protein L25 [Anaerolineaceae bacterium]|nr:50S ribosomal protein L25 [Anaerolineaceae bacterium]HPC06391.1 50S ribosomal protein L25 [Anaerolineaceae bacterium]